MELVITSYSIHYTKLYDLNFVAIIGVLVGLLLGLKIENRNNVILWLLGALFISYLMGPTPYYEAIVITSYSIHYTKLYENNAVTFLGIFSGI